MSRINNIEGIILKKRPFMENDLFITILDKNGEIFELLCKGIRGKNSRRKGIIEIMNLINGVTYKSANHTYLQSTTLISSFPKLKSNYDKIIEAELLIEIISKTIPREYPHPEIYTLLSGFLNHLNGEETHPLNLSFSLTKLAHHLGFLPSFKNCGSCHAFLEDDHASWEKNQVLCKNCKRSNFLMPLKYRKAFEFFRNSERHEIEKITVQLEEIAEMLNFLPNVFANHLEKPLRFVDVQIN